MCLLTHCNTLFSPICHCSVWLLRLQRRRRRSWPTLTTLSQRQGVLLPCAQGCCVYLPLSPPTPIPHPLPLSSLPNPTLHLLPPPSFLPPHLPRLSVRNLPTSVDEKQLRGVFLDGAGGRLASIKQVGNYPATHDIRMRSMGVCACACVSTCVCMHACTCTHTCMHGAQVIMCYMLESPPIHTSTHQARPITCVYTHACSLLSLSLNSQTHFAG